MSSILERDVKYLDEQYRLGKAIISDEAFDQLEKNLQKTYPLCNYFQQKKSLALPSIKSSNYKQFLKTLRKNTRLSIQPKIDGCAIAIQYLDGRLHKAIKNDGNDITNKIKNFKIYHLVFLLKEIYKLEASFTFQIKQASFLKALPADTLNLILFLKMILSFVVSKSLMEDLTNMRV